jgi:hypothetical protein
MVSISHAIGIVTRDKEKTRQEHGNGCFKHRSTSISYNGWSHLVCGYDS